MRNLSRAIVALGVATAGFAGTMMPGSALAVPVPINGSIGGFGTLSVAGGLTTIVSQLTSFTNTLFISTGPSGAFAGASGASLSNFTTSSTNFPFLSFTAGGDLFTLTGVVVTSVTPGAVAVSGNSVSDSLTFNVAGVVTSNDPLQWSPTNFTASVSASGTCVTVSGLCTNGSATGLYNMSITSNSNILPPPPPPPPVGTPEPASMALLGAGLLGFGLMRRRRS